MRFGKKLCIGLICTFILILFSAIPGGAVNWDFAIAWPDGNYHVANTKVFAAAVEKATQGRVKITIHSGGSLGFKGPEMLTAVRDGLVPIGDVYLSQQVGEAPIIGLGSLPYLAADYDELYKFYEFFRPVINTVAAKYNQKFLYIVPWPSPYVYTKKKVETLEDLKAVKIRTYNTSSTELFNAIGMTSVQLPWSEVVPSLAAGTIESVTTSTSSGVDGKFWEFLKYMYPTRHAWQSDAIMVNLDEWNRLKEEDRDAIEAVAKKLEPEFWEVCRKEDQAKAKILNDNGIKTGVVTSEMNQGMRQATTSFLADFIKNNPEARDLINQYFASIGRK